MRQAPRIITLLLLCTTVCVLDAAGQDTSGKAPGANVIHNGDFASADRQSSYWSGVDNQGYLAGFRNEVPVLADDSVVNTAMPVSVAVADVNGDGLNDIIAMDPKGYLRIYINSGSKTEPKFTTGDLVPVFLSRPVPADPKFRDKAIPFYMRQAPRIAVTNILKSGKADLIIGNYEGDIMLLPNTGTKDKPLYAQPADIERLFVATTKDRTRRWGNVLAPVTWDWNNDGKEDLLVGEGSYSANNIHLLINQGSGIPAFDESSHYQIAYGDGKQELCPTVVDYNGDGFPDLLAGDRSGHIGLYLNKGGAWKPGTELPFDSYLGTDGSADNPLSFGGICTVSTGDMTGGGLFDLVVGMVNGRIALVKNTGTKTAPKFSAPAPLMADKPGPQVAIPSAWDIDYGIGRGNFNAYITVVTAADEPAAQIPGGKPAFKAGYFPSQNKVVAPPAPANYTDGFKDFKYEDLTGKGRVTVTDQFRRDIGGLLWVTSGIMRYAPANYFLMREPNLKMKANGKYTLSMKVKGDRVSNAQIYLAWMGRKNLGETKYIRGDRGAVQGLENDAIGIGEMVLPFNPGSGWSEVKTTFSVSMNNWTSDMKGMQDVTAYCEIVFSLAPGQGDLYISDLSITPQ